MSYWRSKPGRSSAPRLHREATSASAMAIDRIIPCRLITVHPRAREHMVDGVHHGTSMSDAPRGIQVRSETTIVHVTEQARCRSGLAPISLDRFVKLLVLTTPDGCAFTLPQGLVVSFARLGTLNIDPRFGWRRQNQPLTLFDTPSNSDEQPFSGGLPEIVLFAPLKAAPTKLVEIPLRRAAFVNGPPSCARSSPTWPRTSASSTPPSAPRWRPPEASASPSDSTWCACRTRTTRPRPTTRASSSPTPPPTRRARRARSRPSRRS